MVVNQGDIWWVDLPIPVGPEPGFRRPMVVVQSDAYNQTQLNTVLCVSLTSNLRWAPVPGNVVLPAEITTLPRESVAIVSQMMAVDRSRFLNHVATLPGYYLEAVLDGIDAMLGR